MGKTLLKVASIHNPLVEKAMAIRHRQTPEHAAEFLEKQGISYELALIALVGYDTACRNHGVERTNWREA